MWNKEALRSIKAVHRAGVLHNDVRKENWLWNEEVKRLMMIDFERSEIMKLPSVSSTSSTLTVVSSNKRERIAIQNSERGKSPHRMAEKEKDARVSYEKMQAKMPLFDFGY